MPTHHPAQRLQIEGTDAIAFAHAQFSSNVKALGNGQWQFSAWLDPQGRVRALFHLVRLADDRLLLLLRGGSAEGLAAALRPFVFREKVTLHAATSLLTLNTGAALPLYQVNGGDAEAFALGCGNYRLDLCGDDDRSDDDRNDDDRNDENSSERWRIEQVRAGWPWLPDGALSKLLAPALSLHRLHAVVTDKGCYPGQEIIARLHFRGGHKRHLCHVILSQVEQTADVLRLNEREVGYVLNTVSAGQNTEALVVLSDEVVTQGTSTDALHLDHEQILRLVTAWPA